MNLIVRLRCASSLIFVPILVCAQSAPDHRMDWAYPWIYASEQDIPTLDVKTILHVPESALTYTVGQTKDGNFAPDWHPEEHSPMPDIVKYGRKPDVYACGVCHRADGSGGPENASLNGLAADYIIEQVGAFRRGTRKAAVSAEKGPNALMRGLVKNIKDDELRLAANYFASIKPRKNINVVETGRIPKVEVKTHFYGYQGNGESELLGNRIVEVPNDEVQFESRDTHSLFTAYVPPGSIERGKYLAGGRDQVTTSSCETCHGAGLRGVGNIPRLAGRSPTYLARQLYEIKCGSRTGTEIAPMLPIVEPLTADDIIALAAYLASLAP